MNRLVRFSYRHLMTTGLILAVEILFYRQYAHLGAEFHFWLHGLFGAALGVSAVTTWRLMTNKTVPVTAWEAGFVGHVYSAVPDILFIAVGILHMYWMDVFALHISVHFIPAPIPTMLGLFILSLLAYGWASDGRRKLAIACLGLAGVVLCVSLLFRHPIPTSLRHLQRHDHSYVWLCPMWDLYRS